MTRADRELHTASQLIAQLSTVWGAVMDHYKAELDRQDGYPTQTVGAAIPTYTPSTRERDADDTVELTRVERYATQRLKIEADRAQALDDRRFLLDLVGNLTKLANRATGLRIEVPRCDSGIGRDGYNLPRSEGGWSDPGCTNVPDEGRKTCTGCRHRAERWVRKRDERAA